MVCTSAGCAPASLNGAKLVLLGPVLAEAGVYPVSPVPSPTPGTDAAWARLTNVTRLVAGQTKLGDELALLYPFSLIAESTVAGVLG